MAYPGQMDSAERETILGKCHPSGRKQTTCSSCDRIVARIILPQSLKYQTRVPVAIWGKRVRGTAATARRMSQAAMMPLFSRMMALVSGREHTEAPKSHTEVQSCTSNGMSQSFSQGSKRTPSFPSEGQVGTRWTHICRSL